MREAEKDREREYSEAMVTKHSLEVTARHYLARIRQIEVQTLEILSSRL